MNHHRRRLALLAFTLHAPGLRVLGGRALPRPIVLLNLLAIAATLVAMALAWRADWPTGVVVAWFVGHFEWSLCLAALVLAGATEPT
jgi:hypothetical protein